MLPSVLVVLLLAYMAGSIPFGLITARFVAGIDIRAAGSGNIGATNVARVLGTKWGLVVLLFDALKGALPTLFLPPLLAVLAPADSTPELIDHLRVGCGVATILGHMFPCWLGFRGGKGVATALGVIATLSWVATLAAAGVFLAVALLTRYASLASIAASLAFAVAEFRVLAPEPFSERNWSLALFAMLAPMLILLRHRANIVRLWRGEEPRFRSKSSTPIDPPAAPPG